MILYVLLSLINLSAVVCWSALKNIWALTGWSVSSFFVLLITSVAYSRKPAKGHDSISETHFHACTPLVLQCLLALCCTASVLCAAATVWLALSAHWAHQSTGISSKWMGVVAYTSAFKWSLVFSRDLYKSVRFYAAEQREEEHVAPLMSEVVSN